MMGVVWAIPIEAVASTAATNATWIRFGIKPSFPVSNAPLSERGLYVMAGTAKGARISLLVTRLAHVRTAICGKGTEAVTDRGGDLHRCL
jgi:hypothetical protein